MPSDSSAEHIIDIEHIKCRVIVIVNVEHTVYHLVVCNGINNYVNHFGLTYGKF